MEFLKANSSDIEIVYEVVSKSIKIALLECYNKEIVDFFLKIHSKENLLNDILNNDLYMIRDNGHIVGTGFASQNHISLVYMLPEARGKGYGSAIMDFLENKISQKYDTAVLDPTKSAIPFYEKRGYELVSHEDTYLDSGTYLAHDIMQKSFDRK